MKTLARFIIRPAADGKGDVMVGVLFKEQDPALLAPGRVYEIREIMGEAMIVDIGESIIGETPKTSLIPMVSWCSPFGEIPELSGGRFILTKDEILRERAARGDR